MFSRPRTPPLEPVGPPEVCQSSLIPFRLTFGCNMPADSDRPELQVVQCMCFMLFKS